MKYGNITRSESQPRINSVFFCFSHNLGKGSLEEATLLVWMLSNTPPVTNTNIKKR